MSRSTNVMSTKFAEADKDTNRSSSKEQNWWGCWSVEDGQQPTQWSTYFYL